MTVRLLATARHEAGHAVAGLRLGLLVKSATIVADGDSLGRAFVSLPAMQDGLSDVERRFRHQGALREKAVMIAAGPAAHRARFPRQDVRQGGATDMARIEKIAACLCLSVRGERAFIRTVEAEARELVRINSAAIDAVAKALIEKRSLDGDEIASIVRVFDGRAAADYAEALDAMRATGTLPTEFDAAEHRISEERSNRSRTISRREAAEAALRYVTATGVDPETVAAFRGYHRDGIEHDEAAIIAKLRAVRAEGQRSREVPAGATFH